MQIMSNNDPVINNDEWTEIKRRRKRRDPEFIYCTYHVNQDGKKRFNISIGMEIAKLLDWKKGDRVKLFLHRLKPGRIVLAKMNDGEGYRLSSPANNTTLNILINKPESITMPEDKVTRVHYELERNMITIDVTRECSSNYIDISGSH